MHCINVHFRRLHKTLTDRPCPQLKKSEDLRRKPELFNEAETDQDRKAPKHGR